MEQNSEDLTQNLKFESSEMDIVGSVLKVKSTPLLTQIKKPDGRHENANYDAKRRIGKSILGYSLKAGYEDIATVRKSNPILISDYLKLWYTFFAVCPY